MNDTLKLDTIHADADTIRNLPAAAAGKKKRSNEEAAVAMKVFAAEHGLALAPHDATSTMQRDHEATASMQTLTHKGHRISPSITVNPRAARRL